MNIPARHMVRLGPSVGVELVLQPRGAFTDLLSNTTHLGANNATRFLFSGSLEDMDQSDGLVRLLLHEATHHACFAGRFGSALAALACNSSTLNGNGTYLKHLDHGLPLGPRYRLMLDWIGAIYDPLTEGLAVFAEYDLYSGPIQVTAHPLVHATSLYLKPVLRNANIRMVDSCRHAREAGASNHDAVLHAIRARDGWLNAFLRRTVRLTPGAIDQKDSLLRQPLLNPPNGERHYLLGYLAVKRAYLTLRRMKPDLMRSTDIFLMLMIHHWYGDEGLTDLCLSVGDCDPNLIQETIGALADRFSDRWDELYMKTKHEQLKDLDVALKNSFLNEERPGATEILMALRTGSMGGNAFTPNLIKHRHVLRHAAAPVWIQVGPDRVAKVFDRATKELLGQCPVVDNAALVEHFATVELVQSYDRSMQVVALITWDGLVAVRCLQSGAWNLPDHVNAFDDMPSLETIIAALQFAAGRNHSEHLQKAVAQMCEAQINEGAQFRDHVYLQLAFMLLQDHRAKAVAVLSQEGFAGIFTTVSDMQQLAKMSLAFGGEGATLAAAEELLGQSESSIEEWIKEANARGMDMLGMPLFETDGDVFISAV